MSKPRCYTVGVSELTHSSAKFTGRLLNDGGLPTKLWFGYDGLTKSWHQKTPAWWVPEVPWEKSYVQYGLSYATKHNMFCCSWNEDGFYYSGNHVFWLPRPLEPDEGSPFLILTGSGVFDNGTYTFLATTDVRCTLYALVGTRKPYINKKIQMDQGVAFRHDPELVFNWKFKILQQEEGDSIGHTFIIPWEYYNVTYWFLLMGSVDGKVSPSISPFFKFRRLPLPQLTTVPAFGITDTEAYIGGKLQQDWGQGVYLRLRWTRYDEYDNYSPVVGPFRSMWQLTEKIKELDSETQYKHAIIGSHDKDMVKYGWSQPLYFTTEGPPFGPEETYICYASGNTYWGQGRNALWSLARQGFNYVNYKGSALQACIRDYYNQYMLFRAAVRFDTNIIPAGSKINSVRLCFRSKYYNVGGGAKLGCHPLFLEFNDWDYTYSIATFQQIVALPHQLAEYYYPDYTEYEWLELDLDPSVFQYILTGERTKIAIIDERDRLDNPPGYGRGFWMSYGTVSFKAYLEVKSQPPL